MNITKRFWGAKTLTFLARNGRAKRSNRELAVAELPQDFADLVDELREANAEFLIVGGWAVILHGHVRSTDDLDIFVRPSLENSLRVTRALEAFGAPLASHGVTPEHFATEGDAYRFGVPPLKVEILSQISGVTFDQAMQNARTFDLEGRPVPYIGRDALLENKRSAGRYKDLADVEALENIDD